MIYESNCDEDQTMQLKAPEDKYIKRDLIFVSSLSLLDTEIKGQKLSVSESVQTLRHVLNVLTLLQVRQVPGKQVVSDVRACSSRPAAEPPGL